MKATEILLEGGVLAAALHRGWVYIKYITLKGKPRILVATTNPGQFSYVYRSPQRKKTNRRNITVWERRVGWRALRRNRIRGWEEVKPDTDKKPVDTV